MEDNPKSKFLKLMISTVISIVFLVGVAADMATVWDALHPYV